MAMKDKEDIIKQLYGNCSVAFKIDAGLNECFSGA